MKPRSLALVAVALVCSPAFADTNRHAIASGPFQPTWESLAAQYQTPEWFRDAKFGIWAHWGPQCEPEHGDWYARNMYSQGHANYKTHVAEYGHPSTNGFKDVIHRWQAANFAGGSSNPVAAPNADPDGDGLNNAGEYAFNTNPNLANAHPVVPSIATNAPDQFLRVTIPRNPSATDALITVEASPEVEPASWSAAGLIVETDTPTLLQVRDNVPLSTAPRRFVRVRVTLN